MKSKTVILMIVAVACGLAASYMTSRVIADREKPDEEKVGVLVALRNLSMGTLINEPEKFFVEKKFTKGEEPKKAIRSFDDLKDRRLNKPLTAEQFVTIDDLIDKDKGLMVQRGMRAVGLIVNAERGVGGFVLPHSHVDIVSVINGSNGESSAKIILQNILVLAVDQSATRPDDKQALVASTVTVQVTPEQAEQLALVQKMGPINLILRSFDDDEKVTTRLVTSKDVFQPRDGKSDDSTGNDGDTVRSGTPSWGPKVPDVPSSPSAPAAEAKQPEPPPRKVHTMTIYNGQTPTKAIFTLGDDDEDTNTRIEKSQPDAEPAPKTAPRPAAPQKH